MSFNFKKVKQVLDLFDHLPTTRVRVLVTIGLITATGVKYLMHACDVRNAVTQACVGWEPSLNWLIFLSALAGVDITQYFVKSFTAVKQAQVDATLSNATPVIQEESEASTDISELRSDENLKG